MVAVADFEYRWAEGRNKRLAETAAEFVWLKIGHHCRRGKLPCWYVAAQREGSTRTSACHSSIVGSPNATIITVRRCQPLDGLRPASQMASGLFPFRTYLDAHVFSKLPHADRRWVWSL
jgi:hypothetical protein